jgi:hypothetical protein
MNSTVMLKAENAFVAGVIPATDAAQIPARPGTEPAKSLI